MVTVDPPRQGPCNHWADPADLAMFAGLNLDDYDPDLLDVNLTNATEILYRKSGSQWIGQCVETVRPVCRGHLGAYSSQWWQGWGYPSIPELIDGMWYNTTARGRSLCINCESGMRIPQIDLGQYPVTSASVLIDGVALASANYRLDEWHLLTRTDGEIWPVNNDLLKPDSEPGTWSVAITYGMMPPQLGVSACAVLAAELTKHCLGDQKCALPLRVTNVSRQGVTYSLANVMDIVDKGYTGLYFVDLFLQTSNPNQLDRPARVLTPDLRGPRRLGSI